MDQFIFAVSALPLMNAVVLALVCLAIGVGGARLQSRVIDPFLYVVCGGISIVMFLMACVAVGAVLIGVIESADLDLHPVIHAALNFAAVVASLLGVIFVAIKSFDHI